MRQRKTLGELLANRVEVKGDDECWPCHGATAGGEAHPPGPSAEPTSVPFDLPEAMHADERECLLCLAGGGVAERALAWIDAATKLLAEQSAQAVADGMVRDERDEAEDAARQADESKLSERRQRIATDKQAEQLRATVVSLTQDLERERSDRAALVEQAAHYKREKEGLEARVRELEATVQVLDLASRGYQQKFEACERKLAEANALLRDHQHLATVHYTNAGCDLAHRTEAYLSGQPAAPTREGV